MARARRAAASRTAASAGLLEILQALNAEHGAQIECPSLDDVAPGDTVRLRAGAPVSAERFTAAVRERLQVLDVRFLATHLELDVVAPDASAPAQD